MGQIAIRPNFNKRLHSGLPQSVYTMTKINSIYRILTSIPLRYPDPNFRSIPRNAEGYFQHPTSRTNFNPESRSYFGLKP